MSQPTVIFLLGPTASGKTALACALVDAVRDMSHIELVSVDSALVYRDMNIGTAKPAPAVLAKYPHRLIDLIAPTEAYSAAVFCRDARAAVADIVARGNVPLLVGGTMMYVKALLEGLSSMPAASKAVRALIESDASRLGWPAMHARLAAIDGATAARLDPNDSQRIQRALEVYDVSGVPLSVLQTRDKSSAPARNDFPYAATLIALVPADRVALHARIGVRFDNMLADGLVNEVRQLRTRYALTADMPSMRAVGYRQVWQFLDGASSEAQMREDGVAATRQLAKRQLTWLRSMPHSEVFDALAPTVAAQVTARVRAILGGRAAIT